MPRIYIQNGVLSGVTGELKRLIKKDREYWIEFRESKKSINKRKRLKSKKDERA